MEITAQMMEKNTQQNEAGYGQTPRAMVGYKGSTQKRAGKNTKNQKPKPNKKKTRRSSLFG
jgi:hypothetical protein